MALFRIGVISDTHLPETFESSEILRDLYHRFLAPVDLLLHAGDLVAPSLLSVFQDCPVLAVRGNMDPVSSELPQKRVITAGDFRIGLMHGWGPPEGLEKRLMNEFKGDQIDCLVFGHSHRPVCELEGGILLFNPGSATDRRKMSYHSVGMLEVGHEVRGRIIALD